MGFRMIARNSSKKNGDVFFNPFGHYLISRFIGSLVLDQSAVIHVSILDKYAEPGTVTMNGTKFILGADEGGRDVLGQLIIGARNSILIGFAITIITSIIGVGLGIISGYYGGMIDNIFDAYRGFYYDFANYVNIIVFVSVIPKYSIWSFIWIMCAFYWVGKARLFRSKTLSEGRRDYVSASKTMGTSDFKIMFREIMPNLSSLIITNLTINFANGIETTLTFLGFGLPQSVPSLGTLIGYASSGDVLVNKQWVWLPASILILVLMLSINYVGQAFKRSADARQRLG